MVDIFLHIPAHTFWSHYIHTAHKDFSRVDVGFWPVGGAMELLEISLLHEKKNVSLCVSEFRQNWVER